MMRDPNYVPTWPTPWPDQTKPKIVGLTQKVREDGSVYISSRDVPLFHIIAPSEDTAHETALPILREMFRLNDWGDVCIA